MACYENGEEFMRQLSTGGDGGRWQKCYISSCYENENASESENENGNGSVAKKRVMAVIDPTTRAKYAMMWALTHVANKGDLLTLLHVLPAASASAAGGGCDAPRLANTFGALCKACRPEVEIEALVVRGPKLATLLSQVRKLEVSVLVLSQGKPSPFCCLMMSSSEKFVDECINQAECLTLAVRKQSKGVGGYLVSTRWQKNFWLLA